MLPIQLLILTDRCSVNLPADVFIEGEIRPTKAKKKNAAAPKTATKTAEATGQKRSGSHAGLDVCDRDAIKMRRRQAPRSVNS